jgi:hypothetical protein
MVTVRDAAAGTEWSLPRLELALSVQNSMTENARAFGALLAVAQTFEGSETLEIA